MTIPAVPEPLLPSVTAVMCQSCLLPRNATGYMPSSGCTSNAPTARNLRQCGICPTLVNLAGAGVKTQEFAPIRTREYTLPSHCG